MKKNVGGIDKAIRLLVALVIVILAFTNVITGTLAVVLLIVAAIFVVTSILGICPVYLLLGFSTLKKKQ